MQIITFPTNLYFSGMLFKERAIIAIDALKKQKPVTLEQARAQAKRIRERIEGKTKKQPPVAGK